MRLLIHFSRFGPYHHARLRSAHEALAPAGWEVIGLEIAGSDATYAWDTTRPASDDGPRVITVFPGRVHEEIRAWECRRRLRPLLDTLRPDAMAIAGWGGSDALTCLSWCRRNSVRRIVMSETRAADGRRVWWKEMVKRYLISRFDGALVGGRSHRDYLAGLGMDPGRIGFGYDVVENDWFRRRVGEFRCGHAPYFLASNRFIPRKNLLRLIDAYGAYVRAGRDPERAGGVVIHGAAEPPERPSPWALVLLGDGEQKPEIVARCRELGLPVVEAAPWDAPADGGAPARMGGVVFFPGFRQIDDLPRFYSGAACFIHPALEEPWGLVINEAMACGLPVLSSDNVGAAEELVDDGVNGWLFDPRDVAGMAAAMARMAGQTDSALKAMGVAGMRILEERCPTRAFGEGLARLLERVPRHDHAAE